ncbi:Spectrin beta chain, non-erythrocytic 1 [Formica fusca]
MLEKAFQKQQEAEMAARQAEKERVERERIEERKRKEVQRITEERKREEERRRLLDSSHRAQHDEVNGSVDEHESVNILSPLKGATSETAESATSPKSHGISHVFGEKLRRATSDIKRAESMKVDTKKPKRTPSFTTRRRTQSFRKLQRMENMDALRPVEIQGFLERKHELQSAGKKAAVRSWKQYYTVLCGQLLCFFKDVEDFSLSKAATAPITIFNAMCEKADDYTKKKNVFRLKCTDGSEFLFLAPSQQEMEDWVNKISFHAKLPPSLQLLSYDESQKQEGLERLQSSDHMDDNVSTGSSRVSTPEMERKNSVIRRDPTSPNQHSPSTLQVEFLQTHRQNQQRRNDAQNVDAFLASQRSEIPQTQTEFLQMHRQQQLLAQQQQQLMQQEQLAAQWDQYQHNSAMLETDKPPIPPRGAPPPIPMRTPSSENMMQYRRNDVEHHLQQGRPVYQQRSATLNHNGSGQYPSNEPPTWHRQSSVDLPPQHQELAPPLPLSAPPPTRMTQWNIPQHLAYGNVPVNIRQGMQQQNNTFTGRPTSLPPYVAPPAAPQTSPTNITVVDGRRTSESGSESEQSSGGNRKDRDYKRSSVLSNLFGRRKKPSQS